MSTVTTVTRASASLSPLQDLLPSYGVVISAASGGQDIDDDGNEISINSITICGAYCPRP